MASIEKHMETNFIPIFSKKVEIFTQIETFYIHVIVCVQNISYKFICLAK